MAVGPSDRLLEIGCGHGVAVSLVCEKLDGGAITAIDRSPKMIEAAVKRNANYVAGGVASFQAAALHEADLDGALVRQDLRHTRRRFLARRAHPRARDRQRPSRSGRPLLSHFTNHSMQTRPRSAKRLAAVLNHHGLVVAEILVHDLSAARVTCVIAKNG